ncbi:hypothetical protein ACOMHN_003588 [Nucella lapillus]
MLYEKLQTDLRAEQPSSQENILKLHIAPNHQKKPKFKRPSFNTDRLKDPNFHDRFVTSLDDRLTSHRPLTGSPTQQWAQFSTAMKETAQSTIGPKKRSHQDWFDENDVAIAQLLEDKRKSFTAWQNDTTSTSKRDRFKHLQSHAQAALRDMQDKWWKKKADEVQLYADTKNSKMFFSAIKAVYGPSRPSTSPSCQPAAHCLRRRAPSTRDGENISAPSSTDPPLSALRPWTRSHKDPQWTAGTPRPLWKRSRKPSIRPAQEKPLAWTGSLLSFSRQQDQ